MAKHPDLTVAPVEPLDVTGGRTVIVGIILWTVAFFALLPFYGALRANGNGWWLWTCVAGVGLGLLGWAYCKRREQQLRRKPRAPESSPIGAAGL